MIYCAILQSLSCNSLWKSLIYCEHSRAYHNVSVGKTWHQLGTGFHRPLMMTDGSFQMTYKSSLYKIIMLSLWYSDILTLVLYKHSLAPRNYWTSTWDWLGLHFSRVLYIIIRVNFHLFRVYTWKIETLHFFFRLEWVRYVQTFNPIMRS